MKSKPSPALRPTRSAVQMHRLAALAKKASRASYSPYSHFPVGAAVMGASGKIYVGTNVENASYSLTQCAERVAIGTAVAAGEKKILAVCVYTPTAIPTTPCGSCRQVISEFGADAALLSICDGAAVCETTIAKLLPDAFAPSNLEMPDAGKRR